LLAQVPLLKDVSLKIGRVLDTRAEEESQLRKSLPAYRITLECDVDILPCCYLVTPARGRIYFSNNTDCCLFFCRSDIEIGQEWQLRVVRGILAEAAGQCVLSAAMIKHSPLVVSPHLAPSSPITNNGAWQIRMSIAGGCLLFSRTETTPRGNVSLTPPNLVQSSLSIVHPTICEGGRQAGRCSQHRKGLKILRRKTLSNYYDHWDRN
jgi:hypothetical protein